MWVVCGQRVNKRHFSVQIIAERIIYMLAVSNNFMWKQIVAYRRIETDTEIPHRCLEAILHMGAVDGRLVLI